MTQKKTHNDFKLKYKPKDITWAAVTVYLTTIFSIFTMIGVNALGELDRKRALYTPGESLTKKERAAVDSLHDSLVEQVKSMYNKYYRDYMRLLPTITSQYDWYNKPLPAGHCLPTCRGQVPTMNEYLYFLKDFEKRAVEKYYREANEKLKQQQRQK